MHAEFSIATSVGGIRTIHLRIPGSNRDMDRRRFNFGTRGPVVRLCPFSLPVPRNELLPDEECPRAAVILCVRGLDPFLPACLKGLFQQDYPDYDVWIVVDSTRDAAWPVVNKLAQQSGKHEVHVLTLTERLATSSRKIAGMLQAMSCLDAARDRGSARFGHDSSCHLVA